MHYEYNFPVLLASLWNNSTKKMDNIRRKGREDIYKVLMVSGDIGIFHIFYKIVQMKCELEAYIDTIRCSITRL